jgi:hypothetical protein
MGSMPQEDGILGVAGDSNEPMVSSPSFSAFSAGLGHLSHERRCMFGYGFVVVIPLQQVV